MSRVRSPSSTPDFKPSSKTGPFASLPAVANGAKNAGWPPASKPPVAAFLAAPAHRCSSQCAHVRDAAAPSRGTRPCGCRIVSGIRVSRSRAVPLRRWFITTSVSGSRQPDRGAWSVTSIQPVIHSFELKTRAAIDGQRLSTTVDRRTNRGRVRKTGRLPWFRASQVQDSYPLKTHSIIPCRRR